MKTRTASLSLVLALVLITPAFAAITPIGHTDSYGLSRYFYRYHGATLIYWILYPYDYQPDNGKTYPVLVWQPGTGNWPQTPDYLYTMAPGLFSTVFYTDNDYTPLAKDPLFQCFIIVPLDASWTSETNRNKLLWPDLGTPYRAWIYQETPQEDPIYLPGIQNQIGWIGTGGLITPSQPLHVFSTGPDSWHKRAFCSLMKDFKKPDFTFFTQSDFSEEEENPVPVNINYDKIYYMGFSEGGFRGSSYLIAGRDLFAAAVLIDCGQYFNGVPFNKEEKFEIEKMLARHYSHIPIVLTSGTYGFYSCSQNHFSALSEVAVETGYNNKYFVVGNNWTHNTVGGNTTHSETLGLRFDTTNHSEQPFTYEQGGNYLSPLKWLFEQIKENTPADPYPNDSYWDDNVHDTVPNKSNHVYEYLHHNGWAKANEDGVNHYEVVDRNSQAVVMIGNREIIVELDSTGNLKWDKDGDGIFDYILNGDNQVCSYDDLDLPEKRIVAIIPGGLYDNQRFVVAYIPSGKFAIFPEAQQHATITPGDVTILNGGDDQSFSLDVEGGYCAEFVVDGEPQGAISTFDFTGMSAHHTIYVKVSKITEGQSCSGIARRVYNVDTDLWYYKIQDAIDDPLTVNDNEIVVYPGTFNESIDFAGKEVTLHSYDPNDWDVVGETIIQGSGGSEAGYGVVFENGENSSSKLIGFTVRGYERGIHCYYSSPTISNCIIRNNTAVGTTRGIYCNGGSATITNNKICNNGYYNVQCVSTSGAVIRNNIIHDAKHAISLSSSTSAATITNNTIINHEIRGITRISGSYPVITNCIVWNCNYNLLGCTATYSCIQNGADCGQNGNICDNPLFDTGTNDFHLSYDSPCIDKGALGDYSDQTDIDGEPRRPDLSVDMGADEVVYKPLAWLKLDETDGTTASDSSPTGDYDGQLLGNPEWTAGQIDNALTFDGADDYIEMGDTIKSRLNTNYTVTAWIRPDTTAGTRMIAAYSDSHSQSMLFRLEQVNSDVRFTMRDDSQNTVCATYPYALAAGNWYHVAGVRSGDTLNVYVNGVSSTPASGTLTGPISVDNLKIGALLTNNAPVGYFFDGIIDDIHFYNAALAPIEIEQVYSASKKVFFPDPLDGQTDVGVNVTLNWSSGKDATEHAVYFGTNYDNVRKALPFASWQEYKCNQTSTSWDTSNYDPAGLEFDAPYYWRIDEITPSGTVKGDVWSFTTVFDASLVNWWPFDDCIGETAYDWSCWYGYDESCDDAFYNGVNPVWDDALVGLSAVYLDGGSDYFSVPSLDNAFNNESSFSVSGWFKTSPEEETQTIVGQWGQPFTGYYYGWQVLVENDVVKVRFGPEIYIFEITGTTNVTDDKWHQFTLVHPAYVSPYTSQTVLYMDGQQDGTPQGMLFTASNYTKFRIGDGSYTLVGPSTTGGLFRGTIDDVKIFNRALSADDVWKSFCRGSGRLASNPNPADEATGMNSTLSLTWSPASYTESHNIYFGTSYDDVRNTDIYDAEYMGNQSANSWDTGNYSTQLDYSTTYYWRVDEVHDFGITKGYVWRFTTHGDYGDISHRWTFDETSGYIAHDSNPMNGADGTFSRTDIEPFWETGKCDGAVGLDGFSAYFVVPSLNNAYIHGNAFTVAGWFKTEQLLDSQTIIGNWVQQYIAGDNLYEGWEILVENQNVIARYANMESITHDIIVTKNVTDGFWHHFAFVYPGGNSTCALYVDDDCMETEDNVSLSFETAESFRIGDGSYKTGNPVMKGGPFCGSIDDIKIFDYALNSEQVIQLFDNGCDF